MKRYTNERLVASLNRLGKLGKNTDDLAGELKRRVDAGLLDVRRRECWESNPDTLEITFPLPTIAYVNELSA